MPTFNKLGPYPEFQDVVNKINTLVAELQNLMVSLDTLNIIKLNAKVIEAGTVTADKMNVNELSAISANLGHITAGLIEAVTIIGSLIKTANTGRRVEMDVNGLRAIDANNVTRLSISQSGQREPGMTGFEVFSATGQYGGVLYGSPGGATWLLGENGLTISSWFGQTVLRDNVDFTAANVTGLGINKVTGLQSALNGKANVFSGFTGSHSGGTYSNGILVSVP